MNKSFPILSIFAAITLFATAYGALVVQSMPADRAAPKAAAYEAVLGKSLNDQNVADFVASNNCSSTGPFQLCKNIGMALWLDSDQTVKSVYLYPTGIDAVSYTHLTLPTIYSV